MKVSGVLKKLALSSGFLALFPSILIMFYLPRLGSKYNLQVKTAIGTEISYTYTDMNSDGVSEMVCTGWGQPYQYITVKNNENRLYDQWNLIDSIDFALADLSFGNFDHDRFQEIYAFTHYKDSLFLDVNEVLDSAGLKVNRIFISTTGYVKGSVTSNVKVCGFFDANGDGLDEVYFVIITGFGLEPRKLCYFDLVKRKLKSSPYMGTNIMYPKMTDTDGDKKPELFGMIQSSGNYKSDVPFSDNSAWLMVFNDQLNYKFPPVEYPGFANTVLVSAIQCNHQFKYLVSLSVTGVNAYGLDSRVMVWSPEGKLLRTRPSNEIGVTNYYNTFIIRSNPSDKIYLVQDKFIEINEKLEVIREVEIPFNTLIHPYQADINSDGEDELLLYSPEEEKLVVYSTDLEKLCENSFRTPDNNWRFSVYKTGKDAPELYLRSGDKGYYLKLSKNKYFWLPYLLHPGVYLLVFFFILIVKRINTYQVIQKEKMKQQLLTLQLRGIKTQLEPHFTFNTLNSIASLIYTEDRQKAYDYMNKFTLLLRTLLNDAEKIYRSLGEELKFVANYLEMEKLRFGEKFNYTIEIGVGISQNEQVPKMVIQTYAENAIKHGLMPCDEGGLLIIKAEKDNDHLKLTIEDNGIGRAKSAGRSTSTGKGLQISQEYYNLLNQINNKPITRQISDLYDEDGDAAGTRVEVWVPVE